jgi:hypothetical protein
MDVVVVVVWDGMGNGAEGGMDGGEMLVVVVIAVAEST